MTESRERPAAWRDISWLRSTEEEDKSSADLHFGEFLRLFRSFPPRHGESVSGHPAAAAGREESGREGGRGPQTWVGEAACEPAAAR